MEGHAEANQLQRVTFGQKRIVGQKENSQCLQQLPVKSECQRSKGPQWHYHKSSLSPSSSQPWLSIL